MKQPNYLSVIIPLYNEVESIPLLHERLSNVLQAQRFSYEIIYVDDGSKDGSPQLLAELAEHEPHVHVIQFRRNFGQTAAMAAGADASLGEVLIFMDGDLQNDPSDIPRLLAKLEEGHDVVSGWRKNRQDASLSRKFPSWIANRLIARVTGVHLHDYGCTLKAFRREIFEQMRLYGEMHRFLPAYAALVGASITEIPVSHHARQFGISKYGISRTIRVILDLLTVKFLGRYSTRPAHAFGVPGLMALIMAFGLLLYALMRSVLARESRGGMIGALVLIGLGVQCLISGLLGELLTRIYHETQQKPIYTVKATYPQQKHHTPDKATQQAELEEAYALVNKVIGQRV
jgi:glycosyltransferase involved in cell wall biosynthesis